MNFSLIPFFLLFIPILEIGVFIMVGGQIGIIATLAMILVTAIIGSILLRIQGISTLNRIRAETDAGNVPGKELVNGVMIMIAGVLLLTPGFVTDTIGFLLFVPGFRSLLWSWVGSRLTVGTIHTSGFEQYRGPSHPNTSNNPDVVDLEDTEYSETPNPDTPWKKID